MSAQASSIIEKLSQKHTTIEAWFEEKWQNIQPPFYTSVDLRHSGFKLAPIDVNLYPAGFNNLAPEDEGFAAMQAKEVLLKKHPNCQHILIIAENHTRNLYYLEHLAKLKDLLSRSGFTVKLSMLNPVSQTVQTLSGQPLLLEAATKSIDYLHIGNFIPDCIILNNDLSEGFPDLLAKIRQPILPPPTLGWYQRKKSQYFQKYDAVCQEFSQTFDWDNWLINPLFDHCEQISFETSKDQTKLIQTAEDLLEKIKEKHQKYSINEKPYLIIKADSGSYGMGVLSIDDTSVISHLSRKHRQHMVKTKGNRLIQNVIIQEGIPTMTKWNQLVAEPVMYLFGEKVVGGFHRMHTTRSSQENLNTPGMQLVPFSIHEKSNQIQSDLLYAYTVIARLATLAAALEIQALQG